MNTLLSILVGTWFVVSSNFPMWLKGDKTNPKFNYTLTQKNGKTCLIDEVSYTQNNKTKSIKGFDYPLDSTYKNFDWRGKGLLSALKSHWEIHLMDEQNEWAVIWFSKTPFTPEGAEIISRTNTLNDSTLSEIKTMMMNDSVLKKHVVGLVDLM